MKLLAWQSWRSWKNAKGLALLAVLALAIGIGSASAIFTVVNTVLLKPLPYGHGDRWVALFSGNTLEDDNQRFGALTYSDLTEYQRRTDSFDVFGGYGISGDYNLSFPGVSRHIDRLKSPHRRRQSRRGSTPGEAVPEF